VQPSSGEVAWKTYVIPDQRKPTRTNKIGTQLYGPSGAAIWSSPTVDEKTGTILVEDFLDRPLNVTAWEKGSNEGRAPERW
jgi:hypothetical protein